MAQWSGGSQSSGGVRQWLIEHPAVSAPIAILVLAVAGYFTWHALAGPSLSSPSAGRGGEVYFYDLGSNKLFNAKATDIPPITAPSGQPGVRAMVFGWGDNPKAHQHIAYLERYTDEGRAMLEKAMKQPGYNPKQGLPMLPPALVEVRAVDGDTWVSAGSQEGQALETAPYQNPEAGGTETELNP